MWEHINFREMQNVSGITRVIKILLEIFFYSQQGLLILNVNILSRCICKSHPVKITSCVNFVFLRVWKTLKQFWGIESTCQCLNNVVAGTAGLFKYPLISSLSVRKRNVKERILKMATTFTLSLIAGTGIAFWQYKLVTCINIFLYIVPWSQTMKLLNYIVIWKQTVLLCRFLTYEGNKVVCAR